MGMLTKQKNSIKGKGKGIRKANKIKTRKIET